MNFQFVYYILFLIFGLIDYRSNWKKQYENQYTKKKSMITILWKINILIDIDF